MHFLNSAYRFFATLALGKRVRKSFCETCGVIFPRSSPFVEGASGLFCRKCIFDAHDRVNSDSLTFSENAQQSELDSIQDQETQNPYTSPQSLDFPCAFCGLATSNREAITLRAPYAVCRECLKTAVRIILEHEKKEQASQKQNVQA